MIKRVKCNICGYRFLIDKAKVKKVVENQGVNSVFAGAKTYDAIDCPNCGCQKILWVRLPEKVKVLK